MRVPAVVDAEDAVPAECLLFKDHPTIDVRGASRKLIPMDFPCAPMERRDEVDTDAVCLAF